MAFGAHHLELRAAAGLPFRYRELQQPQAARPHALQMQKCHVGKTSSGAPHKIVTVGRNQSFITPFADSMSRTIPGQSTAKLRDAELAEAERKLQHAREQLEAVKAELDRSCQLLDAISVASPSSPVDREAPQFDGVLAALPTSRGRRGGMHS